jgi:hypothetical protein
MIAGWRKQNKKEKCRQVNGLFFFLSFTDDNTSLFLKKKKTATRSKRHSVRSEEVNGPRKCVTNATTRQSAEAADQKAASPPPKKEVVHYAIFTIDFPSSRQKSHNSSWRRFMDDDIKAR